MAALHAAVYFHYGPGPGREDELPGIYTLKHQIATVQSLLSIFKLSLHRPVCSGIICTSSDITIQYAITSKLELDRGARDQAEMM